MEFVWNWIIDNLGLVIPCLLGLIEFIILLIFKRKPKIIDNSIYGDIIGFIREAEDHYGDGHGKDKLIYVVHKLAESRSMPDVLAMFCYRSFIENVLDTPQKKGGK